MLQRLLLVLKPDGARRYRRIIVGRKRLPDPASHEREWAFVGEVADQDGHAHLAYRLLRASPARPRSNSASPRGELRDRGQESAGAVPAGAGLSDNKRADFPQDLLVRFDDRRFAPLDPPTFLDYPGAEIVLIAAAERVSQELGIELDAEAETLAEAHIFEALGVRSDELPVEPLDQGRLR